MLLLCVGPMASAQGADVVVEYDDAGERAAAWALLRRPVAFEAGRAELTAISQEIVAEQALTLAQNPGLGVLVGIEVDATAAPSADAARALFEARAATLAEAYRAAGVADGQVEVVHFDDAPVPDGVVAESVADASAETAVVFHADGAALGAGVQQVAYHVESWPGAEVFLIPQPIYQRDERVVCEPPGIARVGFARSDGTLAGRSSRRAVVFVAHRAGKLALGFHAVGDPTPVELTTPPDPTPCD